MEHNREGIEKDGPNDLGNEWVNHNDFSRLPSPDHGYSENVVRKRVYAELLSLNENTEISPS
ncbi:hypothetical protein QE152_g38430, partial [Popillia japonica]